MEKAGKRGLVIGKFYPPHHGHKFLIDYALERVEDLIIVVCWKEKETIPGHLRVKWLQEIHPTAHVYDVQCDDIDDDDSEGWANIIKGCFGTKRIPEYVFTSENYGWAFCRYLGAKHVQVNKARLEVPISATMVRSNPRNYFDKLEPCVRSYFIKRVALIGSESTGTTTLARKLASVYKTAWVQEYGRVFYESMLNYRILWTDQDFIHIASTQNSMEDELAKKVDEYLFCDTTSLATAVWQRKYLGKTTQLVLDLGKDRQYDLYVVTYPDIPYVQDGTRNIIDERMEMHQWFVDILEENNHPYIIVNGSLENRIRTVKDVLSGKVYE